MRHPDGFLLGRPRARRVYVAVLVAASSVAQGAGATEGFNLVGIGPVQKSLVGAGAASPQDSTWMLMNPASIVDLEKRFDAYLEVLEPTSSVDPEGFPLLVNSFSPRMVDSSVIFVPGIGVIWPLNENATLGFGVLSASGNTVDYSRSRSTLGLLQNSDRRNDYWVIKAPLALAYRFDNGWVVGAAVHGDFTRLRIDSVTLQLRPTHGDFTWDPAWGFGFAVGLYKRWEKWGFGAAYTTRQWVQDFDEYDDLVVSHLDLPPVFQVGLSYKLRPDLEFVADYKRIEWHNVSMLGNSTIQSGLGFQNQDLYKFGAVWQANDKLTLRAGISHGEPAVKEEVAFASALFPAVVDTHIGFGASYALDEHSLIHFTYMKGLDEEAIDNGKGDLFSKIGYGTKTELNLDSWILGYTYKF